MECERLKKILLTFETENLVNPIDVKFCILYALKHQSMTYRVLLTLLDLLKKLSISSEFVCVKIISYMTDLIFDTSLIFLGCTCRFLSTPNFYVNISENTAVHILVYICMQLSSKINSQKLNLVFSLFLSIGSDISLPAFKFIENVNFQENAETVQDFLNKSTIYPKKEDVNIYLNQIPNSHKRGMINLCIKTHSITSLKYILSKMKIPIDKSYEYANFAVDTYNWKAFKKIFDTIDLGFKSNLTLNYCLVNKILYMMDTCTQTDTRACDILKKMLHILCSRGTSLDQTQWLILSQLGYDKELMNAHYNQCSGTISLSLRELCIKLGISPTLKKDEIHQRIKAYDLHEIKKYSLVRIPDKIYNFDTVDCVSYTDENNICWFFTSTNIESILSTKINPYTGMEISSKFLEQLMIYRTINRRLSLLKYQYNHEKNSQELISSTRSVFCTKTIIQTAKLFGIKEEDILRLSISNICEILNNFSIRTDILFPISEDDKTLIIGNNFAEVGHILNTFCQLVYDIIHHDLKLAKYFYAIINKFVN